MSTNILHKCIEKAKPMMSAAAFAISTLVSGQALAAIDDNNLEKDDIQLLIEKSDADMRVQELDILGDLIVAKTQEHAEKLEKEEKQIELAKQTIGPVIIQDLCVGYKIRTRSEFIDFIKKAQTDYNTIITTGKAKFHGETIAVDGFPGEASKVAIALKLYNLQDAAKPESSKFVREVLISKVQQYEQEQASKQQEKTSKPQETTVSQVPAQNKEEPEYTLPINNDIQISITESNDTY